MLGILAVLILVVAQFLSGILEQKGTSGHKQSGNLGSFSLT